MLKKGDFLMIQNQAAQGRYLKDIAAQLGVHPRTVRRALKRGSAPKGQRGPRASKLDPFKPKVDALLAEGVRNGVVILREIQSLGYAGGRTVLTDYIRPKRPLLRSRATVRFETEPGRQAQLDWGEIMTVIQGVETRVYFSAVTLGYARRFHAWGFDRLDAEHLYESVVRAFTYFGGATAELLIDNVKRCIIVYFLTPTYMIGNNIAMYRNVSWRTGAQHHYSRITTQTACTTCQLFQHNADKRSRTSGKYFFDLFMAPFSQWLEPPPYSGAVLTTHQHH